DLPVASASGPAAVKQSHTNLVITVTKDGTFTVSADKNGLVNNQANVIRPDELPGILVGFKALAQEQGTVNVRADKNTVWDNVAIVINACKAAGITQPDIETDQGSTP